MAYIFQKKYKSKSGKTLRMKKWTIRYSDANGEHERPGFRDKRATEALALQLETASDREEVGIDDPYREHRHTPIADHIAAFRVKLERKGRPKAYIDLKVMRITKLLVKCKRLSDITEDRILDALKAVEGGAQTRNHYLQAVKQFVRWAVPKRMKENPLTGIESENVRLDPQRKIRRALTYAEVGLLLVTTRSSSKVFRRLTGRDRAMLYLVAVTTGLRAEELASLWPHDFMLDGDCPAVKLSAASDKAGREVEQPLPPGIVPELRAYLANLPSSQRVWSSSWPERAWLMVRHDLKTAGIPQETNEGYFDFHAWRHTYISLLAATSLQPKMVQDLARHSDIRLTMTRYAHTQRQQRSEAVRIGFPCGFPGEGANKAELVIRSDNAKVKKHAGKAVLPTGIEPVTYGLGNLTGVKKSPGNKGVCEHCKTIPLYIPRSVLKIIKAWPKLPPKVRKAILALAA